MTDEEWPFGVPRNTAAVTTASVSTGRSPILIVQHLVGGEGWTFLDGGAFDIAQAVLATMGRIFDLDSSVGQLRDLPEGWCATRSSQSAPWVREADDAADV
jgi:hypothetical protein